MAYDDMGAKPAGDVKAILEGILATGKPSAEAILAGLEEAGIQVIGTDAPLMGEGEDPTGMRPERNPVEGTGGTDDAGMGEPMDIDQIGAELFASEMGGAPPPAT